jgi:hypothetical protein
VLGDDQGCRVINFFQEAGLLKTECRFRLARSPTQGRLTAIKSTASRQNNLVKFHADYKFDRNDFLEVGNFAKNST